MLTKAAHIEWCKERARAHLSTGNVQAAVMGFLKDLQSHPEPASDDGLACCRIAWAIAPTGLTIAAMDNSEEARRFVEAQI